MTIKNHVMLILSLVACSMVFAYAHWIEPSWIEITRHTIKAGIPRHLKVAHLSDLHIRSIGHRESKIHFMLEQEKPDVVLITGDSIAECANYEALGIFLGKMHAPLGVWSVRGNWEHWLPNEADVELYQTAGIRLLNNSAEKLIEGVWVVGIDDESAGTPDLKNAVKGIPENAFRIGLFHSPAFFDHSAKEFHLALAGHTHGG